MLKWCAPLPSTIMKKIGQKAQKLRFFWKFRLCHFFYFIDPQRLAKCWKKLMSGLWHIQRQTNRQKDHIHRLLHRTPLDKPGSQMDQKMAKISQILYLLTIFQAKTTIKSPILKISPKNSLTLFPYIFWLSGKYFSQFKQKMKSENLDIL